MALLTQEGNSRIRVQVDVTKWDGRGKLSKATRIVQHCGSTKRSREIKKTAQRILFVMPLSKAGQSFFFFFFSNSSAAARLITEVELCLSASDRTSKVRRAFRTMEILAEKEG